MLSADKGVRGFRRFADSGIMVFLGIPFALPPIGHRRFSKPEPTSWTGVKDALTLPPKCLQLQIGKISGPESEDCLYLNVFTPNNIGSLPVMVWIHGGGFAVGSGIYWDGTQLAKSGVVVVTINYRLGPFGFASTGDAVMAGNFGMLDQVLALKWVQKNIRVFGGDTDRVTVFGNSAGATSISLHLLSPLSGGLFQRAIMESGSAFNLWGVERKKASPTIRDATMNIADGLGCSTLISTLLLDCLKKVDARAIVREANRLINETNNLFAFIPRVETTFGFLPDYPEVFLEYGRYQNVETMSGFNSGEAAIEIHAKFPNATGISKAQFKQGLHQLFTWCSFVRENEIVDHFADFYLKNVTDPKDILSKLYEAGNDLFKIPILIQLRMYLSYQRSTKEQRLFQFDFDPRTLNLPKNLGLPHAKERTLVFYSTTKTTIFTNDNMSMNLSSEGIKMALAVQNIWINFAKSGKPTDRSGHEDNQWPAYTFQTPWLTHIDRHIHLTPYTKQKEIAVYWEFIEYISTPQTGRLYYASLATIGAAVCLTAFSLFNFYIM